MMNDMLTRLFWMQRNLQNKSFGFDFAKMTADDRIDYLRLQTLAAINELGEALDEVDWKPWAQVAERKVRREQFVNELVDVLHFWINMVLAVSGKMSSQEIADEVFTRFALKNRVNAERQVNGYDGRQTKCLHCKAAFDDPDVTCWRRGDQGYCAKAEVDVNYIETEVVELKPAKDKTVEVKSTKLVKPIKTVDTIKPLEICGHCKQVTALNHCYLPTDVQWGWCGFENAQIRPLDRLTDA